MFLINSLLVVVGLFVYLSLYRQVMVRGSVAASFGEKQLGFPEAIVAGLLVGWFALNMFAVAKVEHAVFRTSELLLTGGFSIGVVVGLTLLLYFRGFSVLSLGGFSRLGFGRIVSTAVVLLFAAYPLLFVADGISRWLLGEGSDRQQIVEMFTSSQTLQQRVLIIILAVTIAPFAEEFIFRFFLYGVLKRYLGRGPGLILMLSSLAQSTFTFRVSDRSSFSAAVSRWLMSGAARSLFR